MSNKKYTSPKMSVEMSPKTPLETRLTFFPLQTQAKSYQQIEETLDAIEKFIAYDVQDSMNQIQKSIKNAVQSASCLQRKMMQNPLGLTTDLETLHKELANAVEQLDMFCAEFY